MSRSTRLLRYLLKKNFITSAPLDDFPVILKKCSNMFFQRVLAFASPLDIFLIFVGIASAIGCGSVIPDITVR